MAPSTPTSPQGTMGPVLPRGHTSERQRHARGTPPQHFAAREDLRCSRQRGGRTSAQTPGGRQARAGTSRPRRDPPGRPGARPVPARPNHDGRRAADGEWIEQGSHADLVAVGGAYARMWATQAQW